MPLQIATNEAPKFLTIPQAQKFLSGFEKRIQIDETRCCEAMYLAVNFKNGKFACLHCHQNGTIDLAPMRWAERLVRLEKKFRCIVTGRIISNVPDGNGHYVEFEIVSKEIEKDQVVSLLSPAEMDEIGLEPTGPPAKEIRPKPKPKPKQHRCEGCRKRLLPPKIRCSACADKILARKGWDGDTCNLPTTNANVRVPSTVISQPTSLTIKRSGSRMTYVVIDNDTGESLKNGLRNMELAKKWARNNYPLAKLTTETYL